MINTILQAILDVVNTLVGLILAPIDAVLLGSFPDLGVAYAAFTSFLLAFRQGVSVAVSWLFIPAWVWDINIALMTLGLTLAATRGLVAVFKYIKMIKFW